MLRYWSSGGAFCLAIVTSFVAQVVLRRGWGALGVALSAVCVLALAVAERHRGGSGPASGEPEEEPRDSIGADNPPAEADARIKGKHESIGSVRGCWLAAGGLWAAVCGLAYLDVAYWVQVLLWLGALGCVHAWRFSRLGLARWSGSDLVALATLLAIALLLRVYALELYPTGMHGDEGSLGLWGARVARGEPVPPFAVGWDFHPTLFHYGQALGMWWAGYTVAGNRLFSAILGSFAVVPLYGFLARRWGRGIAVAGALLQAVMPWHLYFSRTALNDIGVGLCALGAMLALFDAVRRDEAAVAAGTWLGLSLYFGNKAVLVPLMMAAGGMGLWAAGALAPLRDWRRLAVIAAVAIGVASPQLSHYARHDWYGPLLHHPMTRLVGNEAKTQAPLPAWRKAGEQAVASLSALQARSDRSIFLSFTGVPLLPRGLATLYFLGLALCLCRWRQPLSVFLLAWLATGLMATALTINPPQAHRLVPMISVPIVFASLGLVEILRWTRRWLAVPLVLFLLVGAVSADALYEAWRYYAAPTPWLEVTEIGRALARFRKTHEVVLVTAPMSDSNGTLQFLVGDMTRVPKLYAPLKEPWPQGDNTVFLVSWRRAEELPKLRAWFPGGREQEVNFAPGARFVTVYEAAPAPVAGANPGS